MRVAILTISDRSYHGERADKSGPAVAEGVLRLLPGAVVVERTILPDEREDIAWNLKRLADTGAGLSMSSAEADCEIFLQAEKSTLGSGAAGWSGYS